MSTTTPMSRIDRRGLSRPSYPTLLFALIVVDATITAYAMLTVGHGIESSPVAQFITDALWRTVGLDESVYVYVAVYLSAGGVASLALAWGREHIEAVPGGRYFSPALVSVFAISPIVNLYVLSQWISHINNAGWGL